MTSAQEWLSPATTTAWRALLEVHPRLVRIIEDQLASDGGLNHPQYGILLALQGEPQGLTMGEIARAMVLSKSGMTYQVDRLVDTGRVTRAVDPDDSRRRVVRITRVGLDALDDVREGHLALIRDNVEAVLPDGEMEALARALHRLNAHLKASES